MPFLQLSVQQAGNYNFCISSDDGSMFYISTDGSIGTSAGVTYRLLIDDDGLHGPQQRCRSLALGSGSYPVRVTGFQAGGGVFMQV